AGAIHFWPSREPESSELSERFTNGVGMPMVLIRKGKFKMGSPEAKRFHPREVPQHLVSITRDFYMGATEVTRDQFGQFVKDDNYKTEREMEGKQPTWQTNDPDTKKDQAVVWVTWNDAMAFCRWLGKKEGKPYDLPTEAEWEYACRAGGQDGDTFCFGDKISDLDYYAWFHGTGAQKPRQVGMKRPNAWGLHDMHGNVWEWCKDGERKYPDLGTTKKEIDPIEDPKGPLGGDKSVVRGGAYDSPPEDCRSAHRDFKTADHSNVNLGFRVVLRSGLRAP